MSHSEIIIVLFHFISISVVYLLTNIIGKTKENKYLENSRQELPTADLGNSEQNVGKVPTTSIYTWIVST